MSEALKTAALKAGIVDLDALALGDMTRDDGTPEAAAALVSALREAKPFLFHPKKAKDMSESERAEALATILRRPPPVPVETTKRASEMTALQRQEYLRKHNLRYG